MTMPPGRLNKYELKELLGQGGMAEVWKALDTQLQRYVAIKLLSAKLQADPQFIARFTHEAQMIAALRHPNIVQIYDFHIAEGHTVGTSTEVGAIAYMVMEYIQGQTLAHYIRTTSHQQRFPPAAEIVQLLTPISLALDYAHQHGMVHRDIKPANILLDHRQRARNPMGEPILSDFGLAKVLSAASQTVTGALLGTPLYLSPEQVQNHPVSAQTDLYSLGVVLYEIVTGAPPFRGESLIGIMMQHLTGVPTAPHLVNPNLPPALSEVLLKSLAKNPQDRFPSASAMTVAVAEAFNLLVPEDLKQAIFTMDNMNLPAEQILLPSPSPALTLSSGTTIAPSSFPGTDSKTGKLTSQQEDSSQPPRPWNVPFVRNPFFTGRGRLLEQLHKQLSHSQHAALTQSAALSGLGGIGKTQTAIEYAYCYREEYAAVLWVRADSRETLIADYVAIARLLSLPGQDAQEQMLIVAAVKHWLQEHESWLLILDNTDDLSLLLDFLPAGGKGHILLTTRAQATGKIAKSLSVEKMELAEGSQLLLRRAKLLEEDEPLDNLSATIRKAAQQLVEELDGLPLALDQAGAYIEETGCSLSEYLALYQRHRLALLLQQSGISSDYPHTVASTWALSFSQVEQADPAAAELLRLCAFLHPDAIPEAIILQGAEVLGPLLQELTANPLLLNSAIQLLRRYSLIKRDPEAKLLNLHRLVQVVLKESLDQLTQRQWAERTVRAVNAAFPEVEFATWDRCELCLPHAQVCADLIEQYGFTFPEAGRLLHAAGLYLRERGRYVQAEPLLKRALSIREGALGPEHPDTTSTLNVLAYFYELNGKYAQAEPLFQRALSIREQAFGPSHPLVADSLNSLAVLYEYQGKYAQAEPLFQRSLALDEQALGPEHPDFLIALGNLALLYIYQGKYTQAERLLQQGLTIRERVLGSEHPNTAWSLLHLGWLYTFQGKYEQAEPLLQQAHVLYERVLGPEHDFTISALLDLAQLYQAQHQDAQAESFYQQALARFEGVLGPQHPQVANTLTQLARLYTRQGHYQQAEPLLKGALAIDERVRGPEHPQTAMTLDALGYLALLQGWDKQAESLLRRARTIREQVLGPNHPSVAQTLHHLAELYEKQGQHEQAQSLYQSTLSIREQALGSDHPDTIATREALAALQSAKLGG